jgi:hypothetical protein
LSCADGDQGDIRAFEESSKKSNAKTIKWLVTARKITAPEKNNFKARGKKVRNLFPT